MPSIKLSRIIASLLFCVGILFSGLLQADIRIRVLLVEDSSTVNRAMTRQLKNLDYVVVSTLTGEDAITKYKTSVTERNPFDIVITDFNLAATPGLKNGDAVVKEIEELAREHKPFYITISAEVDVLKSDSRSGKEVKTSFTQIFEDNGVANDRYLISNKSIQISTQLPEIVQKLLIKQSNRAMPNTDPRSIARPGTPALRQCGSQKIETPNIETVRKALGDLNFNFFPRN